MKKLFLTHDKTKHELAIGESETILAAALRQGLDVPHACQSGDCQSCKARLVEGEVDDCLDGEWSDSDRARGMILTCQATPRTDIVIEFEED